jgi:hypothetical protein
LGGAKEKSCRKFDARVGARRRRIYGLPDTWKHHLQCGPAIGGQFDEGDLAIREILLIAQILVSQE